MSNPLRIIFAGTPEFAAHHLTTLIENGYNIVGVLTQPDRPAGRGNKLTASAVKSVALQHNLPIFQPISLRDEQNQLQLATFNADLMIVVAYGLILPQAVLDIPRLGCINVHGSLLPRWRGAAPIQRALWAGDLQTGITIMQMDAGLDTGNMICKASCDISTTDTSATLYDKLAILGPQTLLHALQQIENNNYKTQPQDEHDASYAKKLSKEEAKLDWQLSAQQLERCIRAFNPWPVSYFSIDNNLIKVWQANVINETTNALPGTIVNTGKSGIQIATGQGILNITQLQPAGKKPMSAQDLLNSRKEWFICGNTLD